MSGPDWEYLYGELLQSTADQKGMIAYLEERRAALEAEVSELLPMADVAGWWQGEFQIANVDRNELRAENERLRDVVDAALLMRSACPMDWTHGDCRDSQCAVVCCALSALDEEATDGTR